MSPAGAPSTTFSSDTGAASAAGAGPLVEVDRLCVHFPVKGGFRSKRFVHALDDVTLHVGRGETLGLVGESGSGKTTLGRAVLRRAPISSGSVRFDGQDITHLAGEEMRALRRRMQLVFQDPYASLNPRMTILELIAEPLIVHGMVRKAEDAREPVADLLDRCGLPTDAIDRYPHAFSGGQRQRIGIARAVAMHPELIVADEPVSALDVSVRAQVVNLLQDLQTEFGLSYLFIAHDLSVVRHISQRIAIMYAGRIAEIAPSNELYATPRHPYTKALLSAVPIPDPAVQRVRRRDVLVGEIPNPIDPPPGCRFSTRCPMATDLCRTETPLLEEKAPGHFAACHYSDQLA
jgi:oligopeptide/dipeptide ABC transporter ATP-binding protein